MPYRVTLLLLSVPHSECFWTSRYTCSSIFLASTALFLPALCILGLNIFRFTGWLLAFLVGFAEGKLKFVDDCSQSGEKARAAILIAMSNVDPSAIFGQNDEVDVELIKFGAVRCK